MKNIAFLIMLLLGWFIPSLVYADGQSDLAAGYGYALSNQRINTHSYSNSSGKVSLSANDLAQGQIEISARLSNLDKVDKMLISVDNGRTWDTLLKGQDILYSFAPILDKVYQPILKIKTTDIQEITINIFPNIEGIVYKNTITDQDIVKAVKALADSYESRDLGKFTDLVSGDFLGDKAALEKGVRFDFQLFTNIHLVIYIDRIDNRNDQFIAQTHWEKTQAPISTGQQQKTVGTTQMAFALENGQVKLINLKGNLIYATLSPDIAETSGLSASVVNNIIAAAQALNPIQPGSDTSSPYSDQGGTLTLTSPVGGEVWVFSTIHPITWGFTGSINNVELQYSLTGPTGPWTLITASTPVAALSYSWHLPSASSSNVFVKITSTSNPNVFGISPAAFTIS